ncbi:MAG: hypothetical protein ACT4R6_00760 [Gemmatimonadaceae bacterium]
MPIDAAVPPDGKQISLELTDAGAVLLAPSLGAQLEAVNGRVAMASDTAISLGVTSTRHRNGRESLWSGERVSVPLTAVARMQERRLDKQRSWLASGLAVAGVLLLGAAFGVTGTGLDGLFGGRGGGSRQ